MTSTPTAVIPWRVPSANRRRLLIAAVLVAFLCAGYLSAAFGVRLEPGGSWWHGTDAQSLVDGSDTEVRFDFAPDREVTFGVSIRNPGPWPVTITAIAVDDGPAERHVFTIAHLATNAADVTGVVFDPAAAQPFRPTRMAAGTELAIFVTIRMPNVQMASGSGLFFDDLAVDYEVLGLRRGERVPMGFRASVYSADGYVPAT